MILWPFCQAVSLEKIVLLSSSVWGVALVPFPSYVGKTGNEASVAYHCDCIASFPGLLSPNAVEGLVKLIRIMTSGGRLEAWHFQCYACTAR